MSRPADQVGQGGGTRPATPETRDASRLQTARNASPATAAERDASLMATADASRPDVEPGRVPQGPTGRVPQDLADARDASRDAAASRDASREYSSDASRGPGAPCDWCEQPIPSHGPKGRKTRQDAEVCGVVCRKRRHRYGTASRPVAIATGRVPRVGETRPARPSGPMRFAYADPPYPGRAHLYPENAEVDHAELIAGLEADFPDGWALSTRTGALREVLALCPPGVRVACWRRRVRVGRSMTPLSAWEPLIVARGRPLPTDAVHGILDDLETADIILDDREATAALDYRGRFGSFPGALVGMKPPQFAVWLFEQLGARAGDELADLFPGSGAITRAWHLYTAEASRASTSGTRPGEQLAASRPVGIPTSRGTRPGDPRDG